MPQKQMNFNFVLKTVDGSDLKDSPNPNAETVKANRVLANALGNATTGDALKYLSWAQDLYAGKDIFLDQSDVNILQKFLETPSQQMPNYIRGQLLGNLLKPVVVPDAPAT